MQYRLAFYQGDIALASALAEQLYDLEFKEGTIPLSKDDLWDIQVQIPYWQNVLSIASAGSPLVIDMLVAGNDHAAEPVPSQTVGRIKGYRCELGARFQFKIQNTADFPVFIYMIQIDTVGRIEFVTPWREITTALGPQEGRLTYSFRNGGRPGLFEIRFYASAVQIPELLAPPSIATRAVSFGLGHLDEDLDPESNPITDEDLSQLKMQAINFFSVLQE